MTNDDTNEATEANAEAGEVVFDKSESEAIAEQEETEEIYAYGSAVSTGKTFKRPVGRPTLEAAAREKTRLRVQRWREKQIPSIWKTWAENLAQLPEPERAALLTKRDEVAVLRMRMDDAISGITGKPGDFFPDLVFRDVKEFISRPGCELICEWVPYSVAEVLPAEEWASSMDDEIFKQFGLRTRIVKLFFREFLRHLHNWIAKQNPDVAPEVAEEIKNLLESLDPPKEAKYVPGPPMPFVSETAREQAILDREVAEEYRKREVATFERWRIAQLGQTEARFQRGSNQK